MYRQFLLILLLLLLTSVTYPGPDENKAPENMPFVYINDLYLCLEEPGLNREALSMAVKGQQILIGRRLVNNSRLITIIDYSRPSNENRFFVIDLESNSILYKTLVAHGRNSGEVYATHFSNQPQSHESALGFYLTGSTYKGGQGYSLLLNGVDTGYNDNARTRAIVIHGASYVTPKYIERYGRLGRSLGCPALPPGINASVIDAIKEGSVVFAYYPDKKYLSSSSVLF